jgi:ribosome-associated protein
MDIRKLQRAIVDGLEDVKAQHVAVFNTEHLSPLFERVIIASGTSNRQTKALAASVRDTVRSRGLPVMRTEGEDNGEWIIVDCGAAVVHIMQPAIREYYHLEEIWGGKAVKMKLAGAEPTRLVKAAEPLPHASETAVSERYLAARRPPAKAPAKKRATASRPAGARSAAATVPARKTAARKTATGKSAAIKRSAGKRRS